MSVIEYFEAWLVVVEGVGNVPEFHLTRVVEDLSASVPRSIPTNVPTPRAAESRHFLKGQVRAVMSIQNVNFVESAEVVILDVEAVVFIELHLKC